MSTPALYTFLGASGIADASSRPDVSMYVHYDGYPAGAAAKFLRATQHHNQRGGMAERFLRSEPDSELISKGTSCGHQFTYTVSSDGLRVMVNAIVRNGEGHRTAKTIFHGAMIDFINENDELHQTRVCLLGKRIVTKEQLEAMVSDRLGYAAHASHNGWTGNSAGAVNDAWRALTVLIGNFGDTEFSGRASFAVDYFDAMHCAAYGWSSQVEGDAMAKWKDTFRKEAA